MIKVLFYHANDTLTQSNSVQLYLGVSALYLKTWIEKNRLEVAQHLDWLLPLQRKLSDTDLINLLNTEKPDFFCTSHYIWNHSFLIGQLARIRPYVSSDVTFIAGGPSIDVNIDSEFFQKYPYIEYAMYGAGEVAFADLVESKIYNKKLIAFNTSNIAWFDQDKQKTVVAEFKYVPQLTVSPYTSNEELFSSMVMSEQKNGVSVIVPYDLTRGCPYSCTFCDWNSGLTNKTTRRKGSYQSEIDLFQKLKIKNIYLSDANVGQYQEDIDMIEYLGNKNINESAGFKLDGNFSKLRKENNLKIYHLMAKSDLITNFAGFTISVQDINPAVLKNIDRPDVGWDVHLSMINELKLAYPHLNSKVQLIQGLPGQTVESWRATLREIGANDLQLQIFISELLSASPAARDKNYQDKFQFKYSTSERFNNDNFFFATFPESCISFDRKDFVKMTVLSHIYATLSIFRNRSIVFFDVETVVDAFLESSMCKIVENNLYDNWVNYNKFYYTVGPDGKPLSHPGAMTACMAYVTGLSWVRNFKILKLIAETIDPAIMSPGEFIKYSITKNDKQFEVDYKITKMWINE